MKRFIVTLVTMLGAVVFWAAAAQNVDVSRPVDTTSYKLLVKSVGLRLDQLSQAENVYDAKNVAFDILQKDVLWGADMIKMLSELAEGYRLYALRLEAENRRLQAELEQLKQR